MSKIPGNLRTDDLQQLHELVDGQTVLQLGCYCGRGLIEVAQRAAKVWVLEDFSYPGGVEGVVEELKANIERYAPSESVINLLQGTAREWSIPLGSEPLVEGEVTIVYRDANRLETEWEADEILVFSIFKSRGVVYAWHDNEHKLRWLRLDPVPVEVN